MKIETLTKKDYNEVTELMNNVFTAKNGYLVDFEKELPKMCVPDDEHMNKYVAIRENGKIVALVGIYPLQTKVCGIPLAFSTVGNVVTHECARGKGYMNALMTEAMNRLDTLGIDASRLGGNRQRYNRFGYELSGCNYSFTIDNNTSKAYRDAAEVSFEPLSKDDINTIKVINDIHKMDSFYVERAETGRYFGVYETLSAWRNVPYVAYSKSGEIIGFLSVSKDGGVISDVKATSAENLKHIVFAWQTSQNKPITFELSPHKYEEIKYFCSVCQNMKKYPPCNFKIINFDKVCDAFMKLKKSYMPYLPDGEEVIEIKDYGKICLYSTKGFAGCEKTNCKTDICFDKLSATRHIFSSFSPCEAFDNNAFLKWWLPLPLSWNTLDRV